MNQSQEEIRRIFDLETEAELCLSIPTSQERLLFRAHRRARLLAVFLIDAHGELIKDRLVAVLSALESAGYVVTVDGFDEGMIVKHELVILKKLRDDPTFFKAIRRFQRPVCHLAAEEIVRETLELPRLESLTDAHLRQAVLAACLAPLRQQVGSCFATAPAILIQREQPLQLIEDLYALLMTGKLKRTFGGTEFAVPFIPNGIQGSGLGNALLKAWEYTLASFSEVKMEFSKWNLYFSLGLQPEEKGGVGAVLYRGVDEKLEAANQKTQKYQEDYEQAFHQVKTVEALLRQAATESDIRRYKAEHQSRLYHMQSCLDMRDDAHAVATAFSSFLPFLVKQYEMCFPQYFQEIYDAQMADLSGAAEGAVYDDKPAGFRLVYKHGRSDPSLWSPIYTADAYIASLVNFFTATEQQIIAACEWEEGKKQIAILTSSVIAHLRTPEFLKTALQRAVRAHALVGGHDQLGQKKPWAYISGGTLFTLLKTYYRRESEFTLEEKRVESPTDLLIFILDTLKSLPHATENLLLKEAEKGLLMSSPTHAFILHPGWDKIKEGWQNAGFTYTWVRDELILPGQRFYASMQLQPSEQIFLVEAFIRQNGIDRQSAPFVTHPLSPMQLREHVVEELFTSPHKREGGDAFDSFLYKSLPLIAGKEVKQRVRQLLTTISDERVEKAVDELPDVSEKMATADQLKALAKNCYMQVFGDGTCV